MLTKKQDARCFEFVQIRTYRDEVQRIYYLFTFSFSIDIFFDRSCVRVLLMLLLYKGTLCMSPND